MKVNVRRNAEGILVAHVDDPKRDRDRLFDMVMSLSDFAHEKGLTDVSLHLEEVLDTILKRPNRKAQEEVTYNPQYSDVSPISSAQRLMLIADLKRRRQAQA